MSGSGAETGSVASEGRPSADDDERAPDDGDRLREAVTAWLSGADEGAQDSANETAEAEAGDGGATDEGTPEVARSAPEAAGEGGKKPTAPAPRRSVDGEPSAGSDADAGDPSDPSDPSGRGGRGEGGDENGSGDGAGARTPRWAASRTAERNAAAASDAAAEGPADTARVAGAVASAGAARAGEGEEGDDAADRPPVARKAPPRPAVDQPTTALKVPPTPVAPRQSAEPSTAAARSGSERTGSESAGSEREAERTTALRVTAPPGGPVKPERKPAAKPVAEPEDRPGPAGATGSAGPSGGAGASGAAPATGAASASTSKAVPEPASAPEPPSGSASGSASGAKAASAPTSESTSEPASGRTSGGAPEGASESAAERTSTFVPLRRDDVRPAASAPKPAASAAKPAPPAAKPAVPGGYAAPSPSSLTEPERTRQQPLPPKPPLDLLAELTNTPPPPQTPVRTLLRRVRIWTPLVVLLLIVFAVVQTLRPLPEPTLSLTAEPAYAFEGAAPQLPWPAKGQAYMAASGLGTLGSSGEQKPVPIASVTKAMTAYVILKNHPLKPGEAGPMIEIDAKGESDGQLDKTDNESTLNTVKKGDKISLRDALAAIMIPSANNIARQLARWDSGSEKAFVEKMNAAAEELGMKNTTYTDPSGLDATTVSTAEDQVKLGLKLVEIKALMDITKLPEWTDPSGKTWRNYNELPPYNGALGIKTGSTTKAGGNLLFAAHKMVGDTDQLIVGAVLAQYDTPILGTAINASKELMLATQDALKNATIVKKGQVVGVVEDGLGGSVPVVATKDVRAVGWSGLTVKLELTNGDKVLPHEAPPGTVVGSLTVGEGASQVAVPVALQQELAEPGFGARLTRLG
ncbi:D-alanyl-D-alanine carboxypeptidase [Streptomyces tirandamycinicus]|uniref:D-alanyl-D-alanine carboxypeptidase n=1 Tax=Streptomyces tirandamycinicus TaxID=2174846 RepID=UPI001FC9316A|nr:hypothetical protein [Streptomyces tirandamycinicus]